jgi:hypothetical protein
MYRFEKAMYENPDQDLNQLWWNIVEKYQMMKEPEGRDMPDWLQRSTWLYILAITIPICSENPCFSVLCYITGIEVKGDTGEDIKAMGEISGRKSLCPG